MPLFRDPPPIEVEVPAWGDEAHKSPYTELFRIGTYLPEGYRLAMARKGSVDLTVDFAACSDGSEMDGFLAQYNRDGYQGVIEATGYDFNEGVLQAARTGVHTVVGEKIASAARYEEVLTRFGFKVEDSPEVGEVVPNGAGMENAPRKIKLLTADAAPVREGHRIRFVHHDLLEPLAVEGERDLVFANNLLYHLSDEQAARVIRNLGVTLAEHGILSLGLHVTPENQAVLKEELGLEPVFTDYSGTVPVMFGRA